MLSTRFTIHLMLFLFVFFKVQSAMGAEFEVQSFEKDPNDLAARKYERTDINGNTCALVKVKTDIQGLNFESGYGIVGDVMFKEGQYWVYLSPKEQRLSIFKTGFVRLDYEIPYPVKSYDVFHMVLTKKGKEVNALPVTFRITPDDANLTVDGEEVTLQEPVKLSIGEHRIKAERENYQTLTRTIEVDEKNVFFRYELEKIKDATVQISSEPSGAKVEMDGVVLGETPVSTFYPPGNYSINIEKEGYLPVKDELKVEAPKTTKHYELEENVGSLTVKTRPEATVTFNGEEVEANQAVKLTPQVVNIKVTMPKAETLEETVVIKRNDDKTIELMPDIQTGTIQVAPTPFDAKVKLKGDAGEPYEAEGSKKFSDIPVGTYQLKIQKEGFQTYEDEINLAANDIITRNPKLEEEADIDIEDDKKGDNDQSKNGAEGKEVEDYLFSSQYLGGLGGSGLNYGWFASSKKKLGWLFSYNNINYDSDVSYYSDYLGIDIGIMNKLYNKSNFKIASYEQIGLYRKRHEYGWEQINDGLSVPFPISVGLIFNIYNFDLVIGIKFLNNNIQKIKDLEDYNTDWELPPAISAQFSIGLGYTF
ncbi:MAG: PEGA domain-containing protein [Bacteroidales bacterium]|nr:PEGA domain-containing protein [Bacteroidales bacterium]MCF8338553.1 PEGA domain-containing protein [Bacteroidales bacterium]